MALAAANAAANSAPAAAVATAAQLRWGDAAADAAALAGAEAAAGASTGAAAWPPGARFDYVLGGDLIYDHDDAQLHLRQLLATVDNLLSHSPAAQFLLARPAHAPAAWPACPR